MDAKTQKCDGKSIQRAVRRGIAAGRLIYLLIILSACQSAGPDTNQDIPVVQAKLLATVYMSPTPNEAEQQATRTANRPTPEADASPLTPTPTVYVGVFLEGEQDLDEIPYIDPLLINPPGAAISENATPTCGLAIDATFGVNWQQNLEAARTLGCPIEVVIPFQGSLQVFERGVMYYQPNGAIWAIAPGGALGGRYWAVTEQLPPVSEIDQVQPPEGLLVPSFGFGSVWYGVTGVRDALGFAQIAEQPANIAYQRFDGGTLLVDKSSGQVFILLGANTVYGPY